MTSSKDRILVRLAMDHQDIKLSGMAGEFAAHWVFDKAGVAWIDLGQEPGHHSTILKGQNAHRPDYLVACEGSALLIDVKTYKSLKRHEDGIRCFGLIDKDWNDLQATARITGLPIGVFFWDKLDFGRFTYGICLLDELTSVHIDEHMRNWKCIDLTSEEMTTVRF